MQQLEYNDCIAALKKDEFPMLSGVTYLDHVGTTLYCRSQLDAYHRELSTTLYGNPHSHNESSKLTSSVIEESRDLILNHFNTDQDSYSVVFTAGCTASLKLLAESLPWRASPHSTATKGNFIYTGDGVETPVVCDQSFFCYLEDDHTSVLGIREVAMGRGASVVCFREQDIIELKGPLGEQHGPALHHLFAFPAQSNFSGKKYPLQWVNDIPSGKAVVKDMDWLLKSGNILVLLDAASLVSTSPLDLTSYPAHFITISFYKMFGFPTGLGALLVRNDCADLLKKSYFGGGTVSASISRQNFHISRPILNERLEDGTVAFLDIVALKHGFAALYRLGRSMQQICSHTFSLAKATYQRLAELKHFNGRPLCILYHTNDFTDPTIQGPVVNFNLLASSGAIIGFSEVDKLATVYKIQFRTGCFCNTGACQMSLGLTHDQVMAHIKVGHVCGDSMDLVAGIPTGSVRVSFGYMSTWEDVENLIGFIKDCFLEVKELVAPTEGNECARSSPEVPVTVSLAGEMEGNVLSTKEQITVVSDGLHFTAVTLENIFLYPVKSCGCFKVSKWPISDKGLLHDREWMIIVKPSGKGLTQKEEPKLCLIHPQIELDKATLTLTASGHSPLVLSITNQTATNDNVLQSRVCGDRINGIDCGDNAAQWLDKVLQGNKEYRLIQQHPSFDRIDPNSQLLSYANEAQFLAVSINSVELFCQRLQHDRAHSWNVDSVLLRFRPNLVFSGRPPFEEDGWQEIHIGRHNFMVTGKCSRCQMICVDQTDGIKDTQPLVALRQLRSPLKTTFGIYLTQVTI